MPCPELGGEGGAPSIAAADATSAALSCEEDAPYDAGMSGGACGEFRWDVKTGTDARADEVSFVPQPTDIAFLSAQEPPRHLDGNSQRHAPVETTTWRLDNVRLTFAKLSDDSDYHLDISDGTNTMITEIPFPPCISGPSPFACFITHARATVEASFRPDPAGQCLATTASVVGVGFFDDEADRTGQAPNGVELHPVLGLCLGADCDPTAQ